ncbi:MAG: PIN domain-containing protein [Terriglobales bacterium]
MSNAAARYLLDTNVLSELSRPAPNAAVIAWLRAQPAETLYIASFTMAELWRGVLELPSGARRRGLEAWMSGPSGLGAMFAGRTLPFDSAAALVWARLMAEGTSRGRPRSDLDMLIVATAEVNGCIVVTANERDFSGIPNFNPTVER